MFFQTIKPFCCFELTSWIDSVTSIITICTSFKFCIEIIFYSVCINCHICILYFRKLFSIPPCIYRCFAWESGVGFGGISNLNETTLLIKPQASLFTQNIAQRSVKVARLKLVLQWDDTLTDSVGWFPICEIEHLLLSVALKELLMHNICSEHIQIRRPVFLYSE